MIVDEIKLYEDRDDVLLTCYRIAEKGQLLEQGSRPAVIICPGGAYFRCADAEGEPVALKFAAMGYHAFVLRYSTYDERTNTFSPSDQPLAVKEHTIHPAPVRDIGKAMLYIRKWAKEWMVDIERMAVCGFSAGGHNAAMYAVYWNQPLLTDFFGVKPELLRPAAVILGYALTDYVYMNDIQKDKSEKSFFATSCTAFLGTPRPDTDLLFSVSPARLVASDTPPMFLWATYEDSSIPIQHTLRMAHALADHQVPFEIHLFEQGDHGLSLATQASAVSRTRLNQDAAQWIDLAEKWLLKRFALDLPEKTAFELMMEQQEIEG